MPKRKPRQPRESARLEAEGRAAALLHDKERLFERIAQLSSPIKISRLQAGGLQALSDDWCRAEIHHSQARIERIDFKLKQLGVRDQLQPRPLPREPSELQRVIFDNRQLPNPGLASLLDEKSFFPHSDRYEGYQQMYKKNKPLFRQIKAKSVRAVKEHLRKGRPYTRRVT